MKTHDHKKDLNRHIYGSFIHNTPKLETIQMCIYMQIDKQTVVYPYNGILLSNKKEQITNTCNNMDEFQKHYCWAK